MSSPESAMLAAFQILSSRYVAMMLFFCLDSGESFSWLLEIGTGKSSWIFPYIEISVSSKKLLQLFLSCALTDDRRHSIFITSKLLPREAWQWARHERNLIISVKSQLYYFLNFCRLFNYFPHSIFSLFSNYSLRLNYYVNQNRIKVASFHSTLLSPERAPWL